MTRPAQEQPAVLKIRREHHDTIKRLALVLSARIGRRISQSEALYLAAQYVLANMDQFAVSLEKEEEDQG